MPTDTSAGACRAAPFEDRFASTDDCKSSFNETLVSAMEVLANSLRLPPDREVQKKRADAPPKATVSKAEVRLAQPRKEAPPLEDDGRTAIYDVNRLPKWTHDRRPILTLLSDERGLGRDRRLGF